ncbi:MAG TPA: carboxypeptidase regulatory-like domain-containing protein [Actinophytocola sp.]|uniref:carboxypeptidase regulatory-like domain-containing protein n=1 Tax=Actinophytocola sp. TaxID=1872138 RepID=UPI002DB96744|nr:carboxypeptidase regulatory-like domain-containing protein [Actinophytocola sp.]HEU5474994.1 carboxypeptidase regulatory-like domain-containing protein [Actinophytocola sp.]
MSRRPQLRRRGKALLGLLAAVLAMLGVFVAPATAAPPPDKSAAKIEQSVSNTLAVKDSADFWVMFGQTANLASASSTTDWSARGAAVVDALKQTADAAQAGVRAELDAQKITYESFYIANAIKVTGGTTALAKSLASRPEVSAIAAPFKIDVPKPTPAKTEAAINAVEWGIAAINADDAWSTFGTRGAGIVVANIDTGVDFNHPALVGKYRGNTGNGTFNHNYNWFDPAEVCGSPSLAPCDNNDHGTHTMGTMVGDDGAGNQIGVAPDATWVAAKGCEFNSCSDASLLASGQWVLAPTDLTGANPRPDLRPNIVNNSWGLSNGPAVSPFYRSTVQAWRAAGIFPAFSNGNAGAGGCDTSGSPGDYVESYSSGAFDINGNIASFSSRGPGENGTIKPQLAAPGVNVRSSVPGGGFEAFNGTSMASPHTSGTVALMWSAAPALIGNIDQTAAILNSTAVDTSDLTCGGTPQNNNVWGEGKLNAFAAVEQSPRGPTGTLTGTVTDAGTGAPIAGANVQITGPRNVSLLTGADGRYSSTLPVGSYSVTASTFGFGSATGSATLTEGQTTTLDLALSRVSNGTVSGVVRDSAGAVVANALVEVLGTPIAPVRTGADGTYSFANVPVGTYQAKASAGGCYDQQTQALNVTGNTTLNFVIPNRSDQFGNFCVLETANYVEGDTALALSGDDAAVTVPLPFSFFFYGRTYNNAFVSSNGHINFLAQNTSFSNGAIPSAGTPNAALYPFWDDLLLDGSSRVFTKTAGTAPNRSFLVEWRNAMFFSGATTTRVDFEAVLNETGEVSFVYRNLNPADGRETGNSATIGIENETGTDALQYSLNTSALSDGQSIRFKVPPHGLLTGTVTDFNDGQPVEGATVEVLKGTDVVSSAATAANGTYTAHLLSGEYDVRVAKPLYESNTSTVTIEDNATTTHNVALHTPRAEVQGGPLVFLAQTGQLRTATLNLVSGSELDLEYTLTSSKSWLWTVPGSLTVPGGETQPLTVRVDPVGLRPGVHTATIDLVTNAGRTPTISVPVTLVVPAYRKGLDAGGGGAFTDANADAWVADQAWAPGGFGHIGPGFVETSNRAIANTTDDRLYQTQRSGMAGYRFDNLPAGTYQVELDFAELRANFGPGRRVFDVMLNGTMVLPGYDPAAAVGTLTADRREFFVTVAQGGTVEVFFGARQGKQLPIINSVRVTHRPDR